MPRPNNIRLQYPLDLYYILHYYFDSRFDMYDYRSCSTSTNWRKAHYTLGLFERVPASEHCPAGEEYLPCLKGLTGDKLLNSFDLWLRKYKAYRYNKDLIPEADTYMLRSDIDRWITE